MLDQLSRKFVRSSRLAVVNTNEDTIDDSQVDVVIWCTGFEINLSFMEPRFRSHFDNFCGLPALFRGMWSPSERTLGFIGFTLAKGEFWPVFEAQSCAFAMSLAGEYTLPAEEDMLAELEKQLHILRTCPPNSRVAVIPIPYIKNLRQPVSTDVATEVATDVGMWCSVCNIAPVLHVHNPTRQ